MNTYKVELEDDNFEIIEADSDKEAISKALSSYEFLYNIIRIDEDYNDIETIY